LSLQTLLLSDHKKHGKKQSKETRTRVSCTGLQWLLTVTHEIVVVVQSCLSGLSSAFMNSVPGALALRGDVRRRKLVTETV